MAEQAPALDLASAAELIDACTHCGLCLESCPTYVLSGEEAESPRGRIVLTDDAIQHGGAVSTAMAEHIDSCVGCMSCVPVCPEGVRYDEILLRARAALPRSAPRRVAALIDDPRRALASPLLRRELGKMTRWRLPLFTPAAGPARGRVALLVGCAEGVRAAGLHRAAIGVLAAEGYDVVVPPGPDCCGGLDADQGDLDGAARRARETIAAFQSIGRVDHTVTTSATCGFTLKRFGDLLGEDDAAALAAGARDICELLAEHPPRAERAALSLRVAYHDPCLLAHGQGIRVQPRALLETIPGIQLLDADTEPEICCGATGMRPITHPQVSATLGERKARHLLATGAQLIATSTPGCAAQLVRHLRLLGSELAVEHPVELLWRAIQGADR